MRSTTRGFPKRLAQTLQGPPENESSWTTLDRMIAAIDTHDTYTSGHSQRVAHVAANLARLLNSSKEDVAFVHKAGLIHDVGKISIPVGVLRKMGALTDEELHLVRLHPIMGASILSRLPGMERFIPVVLHHHEFWDGSGYPSGLSQVAIPFESRLIHVADAYDAIRTQEPYGRGLGIEDALGELRRCSGQQFDPVLVDAMHEAYRHGLLDEESRTIVLPGSTWSMML